VVRRGPVRRMEWMSTFLSYADTAVGPGNDLFYAGYLSPPSVLQSSFTAPTLVRVRGALDVRIQQGALVADVAKPQAAVGIIPWKDNDDVVPAAASLPSPLLDGEFDWVWHSFLPVAYRRSVAGDTGTEFFHFVTGVLQVDTKAMRKMPTGFGLLFVLTIRNPGTLIDSTVDSSVQVGARMLYKE